MTTTGDPEFDAWNPGLTSEIPARLMPLVTLYRPENSTVSYVEAQEAARFCGLKPHDMVAFTLDRLIVHELLIRVTADLNAPDGPNYEDLGISLRGIVARIFDTYVPPHKAELERTFADLQTEVRDRLALMLDRDLAPPKPEPEPSGGFFKGLFGTRKPAPTDDTPPELRAIEIWRAAARTAEPGLDKACNEGLATIVAGIVGQKGRLLADRDLVIRLAAHRVCNSFGSQRIGQRLAPIIAEACEAEGYRRLPYQTAPLVLNVKGASAAGKSTIRPLQRALAERLGVAWEDFALVSPDYWRKYLLDYDSLGPDLKYAGMLTGQELEIIDKKLDGYMERKAQRNQMPHLLIDRFRFDSFASVASQPADSRLLSRFGDTVYMFFIITHPADTVERAWHRGIATGRYKAVDDLLHHNVEAFTGMPQLFFTWAKKTEQTVHFEFLDNSIPLGQLPRTVAFGWNDRITILDPDTLRNMNRYQHLNVAARRPEDVLLDPPEDGDDILRDCIQQISQVTILDPATLTVAAQTENGVPVYDRGGVLAALSVAPKGAPTPAGTAPPTIDYDTERLHTLGAWGPETPG
jgi:hypothetical protein